MVQDIQKRGTNRRKATSKNQSGFVTIRYSTGRYSTIQDIQIGSTNGKEAKIVRKAKNQRGIVTIRYGTERYSTVQDIQTEVEIEENGNKGHNKQKIRVASSREGTVQNGTARYKTYRQR